LPKIHWCSWTKCIKSTSKRPWWQRRLRAQSMASWWFIDWLRLGTSSTGSDYTDI